MAFSPDSDLRFQTYISAAESRLQELSDFRQSDIDKLILDWMKISKVENLFVVSASTDLLALIRRDMKKEELDHLGLYFPPRAVMIANYLTQVLLCLRQFGGQQSVLIRAGDNTVPDPLPVLAKARRIRDPGGRVLLPLNHHRHFGQVLAVDELDTNWNDKQPKVIWRGAPNGPKKGDAERENRSRFWIADLARRTSSNSQIDVGFSQPLRADTTPELTSEISEAVALPLNLEMQLRAKYLLCLEGNDVSSGLKWMLYSKSCILMPQPTIESWFCESQLQPWVHFVPVAPDLSDVEERLQWCLDHDAEAAVIAENGRAFAANFTNRETESSLFRQTLNWFAGNEALAYLTSRVQQVWSEARTPSH